MSFRKVIFWLHLVAGISVGVIIFVMSITGVLLAYEKQITRFADGYRVVPPTPGATHLPIETLLATIRETHSEAPSAITLRSDLTAPVALNFGREKTIFANPYTGEILGEGSKNARGFFRWATDWHRWLGANEQGRAVGRAITGWCNFAFLFLVVSGIFLWFPRKWSATSLRAITFFVRGLRGKARDWNWHNTIGFWSALPLFLIVLSAIFMSFSWANKLLYRVTGNEPPPPQKTGKDNSRSETQLAVTWNGLNSIWEIAEQKVPGWKTITLRWPTSKTAPWNFTIEQGSVGRVDLRSQLTFDFKTGEIIRHETFADQSLARKIRSWARFVHTGEAGGILGQTIAGLASVGAAFLVWTGFALTWRRFCNRKSKGQTQNGSSVSAAAFEAPKTVCNS